jgi:putative ABC transport system substrate-binding protein
MIGRREFITLLGGAATWPVVARAQQPVMPLIGYLGMESPDSDASGLRGFRQGLSEIGFVDGKNVVIEYRWTEGKYDRLPELVAELVRRQVRAIFTNGAPATAAAKAVTTTIPIVFEMGADPVASGLVASLNRPGGNITGIATLGVELGSKHLELLRELAPVTSIMALLVNPANPVAETVTRELQAAARTLGVQLHILRASTEQDLDTAVASLTQLGAGGLVISNNGLFNSRSKRLAALTVRHAVPAIHVVREFAAAGGLMSYGSSITDAYRLVGVYTGRILNGEKPADLPVLQPTKFELVINLKAAKALGLTVPQTLLATADEVID